MKKAFLLIILAATATAQEYEFTGQLEQSGGDKALDTTLTFEMSEGKIVKMGLALQLADETGPPGGGGDGTAAVWDETTANRTVTLSDDDQSMTPDDSGTFTYINATNVGYDTSSTELVYFEVEILANGAISRPGVTWSDDMQNNYMFLRETGTQVHLSGSGVVGDPGFPAFSAGMVLRFWLKGQSVWVGYKSGATEVVDGNPAAGTGAITSGLPAATTVNPGSWAYYSNTTLRLRTLSEDFLSDPLGATALGEQE